MTVFVAIVIVGLGTYLSRAVFILALANRKIPDAVIVALQYVAPAVLAALIVALLTDGDGNVAIGVPEFTSFVVGGAVAWRTKNQVWTLFAGMTVYWIVRALV